MVILNIDMPTKCINCPLFGLFGKDIMYCQIYPRKDLKLIEVVNDKPEWCPIVSDIEDIKTDIQITNTASWYNGENYKKNYRDGLDDALKIIDKHLADIRGK